MRKSSPIISFTALILILASGCKGSSTTTTQNLNAPAGSTCIIGKWSDSYLPLTLKMSSEFTGDYTNANLVAGLNPLEQMAKVWNTGSTRTLITTPFSAAATTGYTGVTSFRDSEIGIYKSYNWFTNVSSSALAITQFYGVVTSNAGLGQYIELTHADIVVNYRDYGSRFTMNNNPMFEFDLPTVVLHEMGHLLGLCHETKKVSIMAPYYLTTQRSLQQADSDLIKNIYVDNAISALTVKNANTNALTSPPGTEVSGIIELRANGECVHFVEGREVYSHHVDLKKRPDISMFKRQK